MYGLRFGRRRDSNGPVGTCCLLIKCKRAASLSLDSPPRALSSFSPTRFRLPLTLSLSIQKTEAALVSHRNQPRADNNEIHKSVREHAEHTPPRRRVCRGLSPPSSFIPLFVSSRDTLTPVCVHARRYLSLLCELSPSCDPRPSLIAGGTVFTILRECRETGLHRTCLSGSVDCQMRSELHQRNKFAAERKISGKKLVSRKLIKVQRENLPLVNI